MMSPFRRPGSLTRVAVLGEHGVSKPCLSLAGLPQPGISPQEAIPLSDCLPGVSASLRHPSFVGESQPPPRRGGLYLEDGDGLHTRCAATLKPWRQ
jgi:hypothetical protein